MAETSQASRFQFGDVILDLRTGRIQRGGRPLALEPRAFDVLVYLVQHGGELVFRETLMNAVWREVHVAPHSLTQAILQLRQALGDDRAKPQFIETVHRRGYRFVAPIRSPPSVSASHAHGAPRFPARTVSLIGRDQLLHDLTARVLETRLVTLTGPGGVGKTQLALELARRIEYGFQNCALVDLSVIENEADVEREIALRLGLGDAERGDFIRRVVAAVRARRVLLVLDNCERVAGACRRAVEHLLEACPSLHVVTTTQQALSAKGEMVVRVPPLPLPEASRSGTIPDSADLRANPAVELFVRRAGGVEPSFDLTPGNASAVAEICRRLDGLPLAIELAASRVRVLTPQQIAERLEDRFRLLARGHATDPPRHETLAAALGWSFALLAAGEQELLTRLGAFSGGWTLDAAGEVSEDESSGLPVLERLQGLVDKSLVVADTAGSQARYRLLETVRLYAQHRLDEGPHSDQVRARHLAYFLRMAEASEAPMFGPRQGPTLASLECETGNLREAMDWGLKTEGQVEAGVRLATALRWYWIVRGQFSEGREWLERAARASVGCSSQTVAHVLCALGLFRHQQADFLPAHRILTQGLERLGHSDARRRSHTLGILAFNFAVTGDVDAADRTAAAALLLADQLRDHWLGGVAQLAAGVSTAVRGAAVDAACVLEDAYARLLRSGEPFMITYVRVNLGLQRYLAGDFDGARNVFIESLRGAAQLRNQRAIAGCFEGLGYLAASAGDARWAARLMGAAHAAREMTAGPLFPQWKAEHERTAAALNARLGCDLARREREAGAQTAMDDLVADILAHDSTPETIT